MMQLDDLLKMHISDASSVVRKLTTEEMDTLQTAVIEKPSIMRCQFAKLVVYRNESLRLLSLLEAGDLNLCRCCVRYLKIRSIRKDLLSKLVSVEEFCKLYNSCCDFGRNALLETLVWNKNRDENCLADCLFHNASLVLNSYQEKLLINACSVNVFMNNSHNRDRRKKKYFRINGKLCERVAVNKLYEISQKKDDYDSYQDTVDSLVPYIRDVWTCVEIDGKTIRLYDLLLDLWRYKKDENSLISKLNYDNSLHKVPMDRTNLKSRSYKTQFKFSCLNNFVDYICNAAPIYYYKYFDIKSLYGKHGVLGFKKLLSLYQCAVNLGENAVVEDILHYLTDLRSLPTTYRYQLANEYIWIMNILQPEHYTWYLNELQDVILAKMKSMTPAKDIIYTAIPSAIFFLLQELTMESPKNQEILELFFAFEKQHAAFYDKSFLYGFYGLQNQEVPLDFPYQMAPKNINDTYKTCRKWESILCFKGNSHLNTKDATDRMNILKLLLKFASQSNDVRAFDRCFNLYVRTEMKFNDISLELESPRNFGPDALGFSPKSLKMSGSAEEAKRARQNIIQTIMEWAATKKGDAMIRPLSFMLISFYYYATLYPEYEDEYTELMRPLCEFLVNKNLKYTKSSLASLSLSVKRSRFFTLPFCHKQRKEKLLSYKEVTNYTNFENFLSGSLEKCSYGPYILAAAVIFEGSCPLEGLTIPAIAKKPLYMLLSFLEKDIQYNYVPLLFDSLVSSVIISTQVSKTDTEELTLYEKDNKKLVRYTTTYTSVGDRNVIKEIFEDASIEWVFKIRGFTTLCSLHKFYYMEAEQYCSIAQTNTRIELVNIPVTQKSPEKKACYKNLHRYLIQYNPQITSDLVQMTLNEALESYDNHTTMLQQDVTVNSLERLLNLSLPMLNLLMIHGSVIKLKKMPSVLMVLEDACLMDLQKIIALRTALIFQTALMAVSINKSDKPLMKSNVISKISSLHPALLEACEMLIYANQELTRRGLVCTQVFPVQTICPFFIDWLTSVNANKAQSFFDMKKEETVEFDSSPKLSIDLDFSQNHVVCRLIELLVYSRGIKEMFGKSVTGLAHLSTLVSSHIALIMCRRFVLVSSFVHVAETVIEHLLMTASSHSAITTEIISMMADSSSCITVALIGLLFRLASKPIMQAHQALMMTTITKVTNYIIENDFKSEDVYLFILKWICKQLLESDETNLEFINELLDKIAKLNTNEAAGKSIFGFVSLLALLPYGEKPHNLYHLVSSMDSFNAIEEAYNAASEEKQELFDSTFIRIVPFFNTTEDEELFIAQHQVIEFAEYAGDYPELLDYCRSVLQTIYKPRSNMNGMFAAAAGLLVLNHCSDADALLNKAFAVYHQIQLLKKKSTKISDCEEYRALGIPETMDDMMNESNFDSNILNSLFKPNYFRLLTLSRLETDDMLAQSWAVWASCLLESLPNQSATDFSELDMDRLIEVAESKLKPWMFVLLRNNLSELFEFPEEQLVKAMESFNQKKSTASAFIVLRGIWERHVESVSKQIHAIYTWIKENKVYDILYFLTD